MPLTTNELIQRSRCFDCLPWSTQFEIQTYIIAFASGQGTDPNTLAEAAKCLKCLSLPTLTEVKAFLLARIAGVSTDPNTLAAAAKCYVCIPDGLIGAINTYLWSTDPAGPGITDPNALAQASKAFQRLSPETLLEIQVYLLALQAGVTTDPNQLAELAKCFKCLPLPFLRDVGTYLVQTFIEGGGCVDVPADLIPVISATYQGTGEIDVLTVVLPKVCCNPNPGFIDIYEADDASGTNAALCTSAGIPAAQAGSTNYTTQILGVSIDCFTKDFILAKQECAGSFSGFSNAVARMAPLPTSSLVLKLESDDFDGSANGDPVNLWSDQSGLGHDFNLYVHNGIPDPPNVSQTTQLNGHATIRFQGSGIGGIKGLESASAWVNPASPGLESIVVMKLDTYPAASGGGDFTLSITNNQNDHMPFTTNFFSSFASTIRTNFGAPVTNPSTAFRRLQLSADATSLTAWMSNEKFFEDLAFATFNPETNPGIAPGRGNQTNYCIGFSFHTAVDFFIWTGWIAAIYLWEKKLTPAERAQALAYIVGKWGI